MKLGAIVQTPSSQVGAIAEQAKMLEGEGFDGLWTVQAMGRGFLMPDPLVALAAAAGVTSQVTLGTAVLQLPLYAPGLLAHELFSLMHLAGDRLRIGLGVGSTAADFAIANQDFDARFERFEECLSQLRSYLRNGQCGDVNLSPAAEFQGGPQLIFGTWGKNVARAANEFDGWLGSALHRTDEQVVASLARYREASGTNAIVTSIMLGAQDEPGQHQARLEKFMAAGFDEAVVMLLPGGPSAAEVRGWVA